MAIPPYKMGRVLATLRKDADHRSLVAVNVKALCRKTGYRTNEMLDILDALEDSGTIKHVTGALYEVWDYERSIEFSKKSSLMRHAPELAARQGGWLCYYCRQPVAPTEYVGQSAENAATVDHKTPLALGGTSHFNNLCLACRRCNLKKGAMTESQFRKHMKVR